jgi:hypothetical protein
VIRAIICPLLTVLAVVCIYLFATGAEVPPEGAPLSTLIGNALRPFQQLTLFSAILLGTATVALFLALVLSRTSGLDYRSEQSWGRVLQLALVADVTLVGAVIVLLFLPAFGWPQDFTLSVTTAGALFMAGLLEAALGSCIVLALLAVPKSRPVFVSSVLVHLAEIGLLGAVFYLGTRA